MWRNKLRATIQFIMHPPTNCSFIHKKSESRNNIAKLKFCICHCPVSKPPLSKPFLINLSKQYSQAQNSSATDKGKTRIQEKTSFTYYSFKPTFQISSLSPMSPISNSIFAHSKLITLSASQVSIRTRSSKDIKRLKPAVLHDTKNCVSIIRCLLSLANLAKVGKSSLLWELGFERWSLSSLFKTFNKLKIWFIWLFFSFASSIAEVCLGLGKNKSTWSMKDLGCRKHESQLSASAFNRLNA